MNYFKQLKLFTTNVLSWESGYDYVFYALRKLISSDFHIVLNIAGKGPLMAAFLYSIEDLKLQENIIISPTTIPSLDAEVMLSNCNVYLNYAFKPNKQYYDEVAKVKGKYIITTNEYYEEPIYKTHIVKPRDITYLVKTIEHIYWEVAHA